MELAALANSSAAHQIGEIEKSTRRRRSTDGNKEAAQKSTTKLLQ